MGMGDAWICLCFREEIARKGRERMPEIQDGQKPASERLARWKVRWADKSGGRWPAGWAVSLWTAWRQQPQRRGTPRLRIECWHWSELVNQQGYVSLRQPRQRIECCHWSQSANQQGYVRISETTRYRQEQFRLVRCACVAGSAVNTKESGSAKRHMESIPGRGRAW